MLTDIFAYRYLDRPIWEEYTEFQQRLLNQAFAIVKEFLPGHSKETEKDESIWKSLHDQLTRELGIDKLSKRELSYVEKISLEQGYQLHNTRGWDDVCEQFVKAQYPKENRDADRFIKDRISFIELAMRYQDENIKELNANLTHKTAATIAALRNFQSGQHGTKKRSEECFRDVKQERKVIFESQIAELNERFRQAKAPLSYHNGFIQVSMDGVVERNIAKPFWDLVSDPLWQNVGTDMLEALDRRDSNDKDPAIFAAKALESAIMIISDTKEFTRGKENGASNYIDNLVSKANGRFLTAWEGEMLRDYFRKVRNSLGHGPGSEPMPELSIYQTDWAIEAAMSWVRTLIRRM